ncbi:MAG: TetR/AcrR family transcriptional regulator [Anaerolineales bacterium]|nr:TetR/AcrR family transcriptional regulator [Anaerolineales bacterium]
MSEKRERIIEATCGLLEQQGYHATGLNEIIEESGAPRGSLYYYFPDGKEELAAEAIERTGRMLSDRVTSHLARFGDPAEALRAFIELIADGVEESQFSTGGPLTAVAMETATTSERLNLACRDAFQRIESAFAAYLEGHDLRSDPAQAATMITAAIEGGIILSRTYHSGEPLRTVAGLVSAWIEDARDGT